MLRQRNTGKELSGEAVMDKLERVGGTEHFISITLYYTLLSISLRRLVVRFQ